MESTRATKQTKQKIQVVQKIFSSNELEGDEMEIITLGGELNFGVIASQQKKVREGIKQHRHVNGKIYNLPIERVHRPL